MRTGSLANHLDISLVVHPTGKQQVFTINRFGGHAHQRQTGKRGAVGLGKRAACGIGRKLDKGLERGDVFVKLFANPRLCAVAHRAAKKSLRVQLTRHQLNVQINVGGQFAHFGSGKRVCWQQRRLRVSQFKVINNGLAFTQRAMRGGDVRNFPQW